MTNREFRYSTQREIAAANNKAENMKTEYENAGRRYIESRLAGEQPSHLDKIKSDEADTMLERLSQYHLDFSIENTGGEHFLINALFYTNPFNKADKAIILGRGSDEAIDLAGIKRNASIAKRYANILSISKAGITGDLKNHSEEQLSKEYEQIARELWDERIEENMIDIFGMLDEEQQKIIKRFNSRESVWIRGFAGTGKTVIGNELLAKSDATAKMAIYANKRGSLKAEEFFKVVGKNDVVVTTYQELDFNVFDSIKKTLAEFSSLFDRYSDLSFMKKYLFKYGSQKISVVLPDLELIKLIEKIPMNDLEGKNTFELVKMILKSNDFDEKFYEKNWIDSLVSSIRSSKIRLSILTTSEGYQTNINNWNADTLGKILEFSNEKGKIISQLKSANCVLMDEAPILVDYPLISSIFRDKTIGRMSMKYIFAFDEYQYDEDDVNELWKFAHFDRKEYLRTIYRTTNQIFAASVPSRLKKNDNVWDAPVYINNSVTYSDYPEFSNVIKLSDVIKNMDNYIGLEFKQLSLDVDVRINKGQEHFLYVAMTRAVQTLNICGEFKEALW